MEGAFSLLTAHMVWLEKGDSTIRKPDYPQGQHLVKNVFLVDSEQTCQECSSAGMQYFPEDRFLY